MNSGLFGTVRRVIGVRHGVVVAVGVLCVGIVNRVIGSETIRVNNFEMLAPLALMMPAGTLTLVVVGGSSSAPVIDQTAFRPVWRIQLAIDLVQTCLAALVLVSSATIPAVVSEYSRWNVFRNLIGLTGIAFVLLPVLPRRAAIVPPLVLCLIALTAGYIESPVGAPWAWLLAPMADNTAWLVAVVSFGAGMLARVHFRV